MIPIYNLLLGAPPPFDPTSRYTTSWILPPLLLAFTRLLFSLYAFTTIFTIFGWDDSHSASRSARQSFSYFTNLTYWGLAFYFLASGLHTLVYAVQGRAWLHQRWGRPAQVAHTVFYTTVVTFPILVTIVFWAILYTPPFFPVRFNAWSNLSQHAFNSFFCLFEIFIPRTNPPPPLHLAFLVLILALYLALAYITHATQGFYPYSFLDVSKGSGKAAGYIIGILVAACIIFGVVWGFIWVRRRVTEGAWSMKGKYSRKDVQNRDARLGSMEMDERGERKDVGVTETFMNK